MLVVQKQIQEDIESQKKKLAELESSPVPKIDKSKFVSHTLQTSATLKFGANRLGSQIVHVVRTPNIRAPHSPSTVTVDRSQA